MKIISKDFCTFTGVFIVIYMGPCRKSYVLLVRKFRTSEMLDKLSPIPKLCDIKLSHILDGRYIFFSLVREPTCLPYLFNLLFDIFKSFPVFVMIEFEYWISCQLCRFRCNSGIVYVLHNFANVLPD